MSENDKQQDYPSGWERDILQDVIMASLKEQRSARRWKIFFRFFWTLLIVGYIAAIFVIKNTDFSSQTSSHVAVVEIKGMISADSQASAKLVNETLQAAFSNPASVAVILRINSPGGSPVQAEIIYDEIRRLSDKYKKPVYAAIEDAGASAAYYIASAADEIYVSRSAIVGSIGVLTNQFGFVQLLDNLGVERRLITSGGHKGMLDPFSPMKDNDKAFMENILNQVHEQFIDAVKRGRGERLVIDEDTFSGLFWVGQAAVDRGLADRVGTVEYIARSKIGIEILVDYSPRRSMLENVARQFGAGLGDVAVDAVVEQGIHLQ